jgi:hypothetical protein
LTLPFPHPPLTQSDDLLIDASVALLREHGLMDAKELVRNDASVLMAAAEKALAIRAAEAAERAAEAALAEVPAEFATVADALKRSPLMLEVGGDHPGLAAIAHLSDDLLIDASVALLREHGLMDAKEMVRNDATILLAAADKALAIREAEAAERAAEAVLAEVPAEFAAVADALKRSPLMLEVGGDHPGLAAISQLSDDLLVDASVALLREHGLMDAKEMVRNDASVLMAAAEKALAIREAEAAERAAAAVPDSLQGAADALLRSPLMLEVDGEHPGLEAIAELVSPSALLCSAAWGFAGAACVHMVLSAMHAALPAPHAAVGARA